MAFEGDSAPKETWQVNAAECRGLREDLWPGVVGMETRMRM